MTILALEFSSSLRTAAVVREGQVCGNAAEEGMTHSRPIALIREALARAECDRRNVERIAIGLGPGSFTGVRTAIAIAEGWQLAARVTVVGLSSMDALAELARREGHFGRVNLVVDAQRGEFHVVRQAISAAGITLLEALRLVPESEIRARLDAGEAVAGPGITDRFPSAVSLFPDAGGLGLLAERQSGEIQASDLAPIFLRPAAFVKASPPREVPPA